MEANATVRDPPPAVAKPLRPAEDLLHHLITIYGLLASEQRDGRDPRDTSPRQASVSAVLPRLDAILASLGSHPQCVVWPTPFEHA